jgi:hypothetical protein
MSMTKRSAVKYRLVKPPLSLSRYVKRYALWNLFIWFFCLWWISGVGFYWMSQNGRISCEITFFSTLWIGFFVGFVGFCTSTLQPRRKLLVGRLEPTPEEWEAIEKSPRRTLSGGFWAPALLTAFLLSAVLGGIQWIMNTLGGGMDYTRRPFQFYTVLLPTISACLLSSRIARLSINRFVSASERNAPLRLSQGRYVFLHNVIPYALFNSTAGVLVVLSRFFESLTQGTPIPARTAAMHLAITSLVIVLFVVGAARFKTRLDFLSPIELTGETARPLRARWSLLWALLVPPVVYGLVLGGFMLSGEEAAGFGTIVALKILVCVGVTVTTASWAVRSILSTMTAGGLDAHPYVQFHRYLRDAGHLTS